MGDESVRRLLHSKIRVETWDIVCYQVTVKVLNKVWVPVRAPVEGEVGEQLTNYLLGERYDT